MVLWGMEPRVFYALDKDSTLTESASIFIAGPQSFCACPVTIVNVRDAGAAVICLGVGKHT